MSSSERKYNMFLRQLKQSVDSRDFDYIKNEVVKMHGYGQNVI